MPDELNFSQRFAKPTFNRLAHSAHAEVHVAASRSPRGCCAPCTPPPVNTVRTLVHTHALTHKPTRAPVPAVPDKVSPFRVTLGLAVSGVSVYAGAMLAKSTAEYVETNDIWHPVSFSYLKPWPA